MSGEIIAIVDGKEYQVLERKGAPLELGKRFICGAELTRETVDKDGKHVSTETKYVSGELILNGIWTVYAGCGTEFLVTKASPSIIECCGKPAVLQKPKPLPSSD
ncbi:MAG: hypothetical protein Q7R97_00780 [Candidatus Daviesbacteria bacterium]|nr:hypothetical protein [Candidatus Daviesbacteria bacterium]